MNADCFISSNHREFYDIWMIKGMHIKTAMTNRVRKWDVNIQVDCYYEGKAVKQVEKLESFRGSGLPASKCSSDSLTCTSVPLG